MSEMRELYAYLGPQPDGKEGIAVFQTPDGLTQMLIAQTREEALQVREIAAQIARQIGQPIRLVHFSQRRDVETFLPAGGA